MASYGGVPASPPWMYYRGAVHETPNIQIQQPGVSQISVVPGEWTTQSDAGAQSGSAGASTPFRLSPSDSVVGGYSVYPSSSGSTPGQTVYYGQQGTSACGSQVPYSVHIPQYYDGRSYGSSWGLTTAAGAASVSPQCDIPLVSGEQTEHEEQQRRTAYADADAELTRKRCEVQEEQQKLQRILDLQVKNEEELKVLRDGVAGQKRELESLQSAVQSADNERLKTLREVHDHQIQLSKLRIEGHDQTDKLRKTKDQLEAQKREFDEMIEAKHKELQEEKKMMENRMSSWSQKRNETLSENQRNAALIEELRCKQEEVEQREQSLLRQQRELRQTEVLQQQRLQDREEALHKRRKDLEFEMDRKWTELLEQNEDTLQRALVDLKEQAEKDLEQEQKKALTAKQNLVNGVQQGEKGVSATDLQKAQARIDDLMQDNCSYKRQLDKMSQAMQEQALAREKHICELQDKLTEQDSHAVRTLLTHKQALQQEIDNLKSELKMLEDYHEKQNNRWRAQVAEKQNVQRAEKDAFQKEIVALRKQLKESKEQHEHSEESWTAERTKLQSALKAAQDAHQKQVKCLQGEMKEMKDHHNQGKKRWAEETAELQKTQKAEKDALQEEIDNLQTKLKMLADKQIKERCSQQELEQTKAEKDALQKEIVAVRKEVKSITDRHNQGKTRWAEETAELQKTQKAEKDALQKEIVAFRKEVKSLTDHHNQGKKRWAEETAELQKTQKAEKDALQKEIVALRKQLKESKEQHEHSEESWTEERTKLESALKAERDALQEEIDNLQTELKMLADCHREDTDARCAISACKSQELTDDTHPGKTNSRKAERSRTAIHYQGGAELAPTKDVLHKIVERSETIEHRDDVQGNFCESFGDCSEEGDAWTNDSVQSQHSSKESGEGEEPLFYLESLFEADSESARPGDSLTTNEKASSESCEKCASDSVVELPLEALQATIGGEVEAGQVTDEFQYSSECLSEDDGFQSAKSEQTDRSACDQSDHPSSAFESEQDAESCCEVEAIQETPTTPPRNVETPIQVMSSATDVEESSGNEDGTQNDVQVGSNQMHQVTPNAVPESSKKSPLKSPTNPTAEIAQSDTESQSPGGDGTVTEIPEELPNVVSRQRRTWRPIQRSLADVQRGAVPQRMGRSLTRMQRASFPGNRLPFDL